MELFICESSEKCNRPECSGSDPHPFDPLRCEEDFCETVDGVVKCIPVEPHH